MSWGTQFTTDVYLIRESFESREEVEDRILSLQDEQKNLEIMINSYVFSKPSDLTPKDWEDDMVLYIKGKVDDILRDYRECTSNLNKVLLLKEFLQYNAEIDVKDLFV